MFPVLSLSSQIAVVGMTSLDMVCFVDEFPLDNRKLIATKIGHFCGGMAGNVALNLRLLGLKVKLITWIGEEESGDTLKNLITQHLSHPNLIYTSVKDTLQTKIFVHKDTAQRAAIMIGEQSRPKGFLKSQIKALKKAHLIYNDGSCPEIYEHLCEIANLYEIPIFLNAEFPSNGTFWALQNSHYVVASEQLFPRYKSLNFDELRHLILEYWGPRHRLIVITMGSKGSCFYDGNSFRVLRSFRVPQKDTTGAGDAFQSGLIYGLMRGWTPLESIKFATAIGGLQCTVIGPNLISLRDIDLISEAISISLQIKEYMNDEYC